MKHLTNTLVSFFLRRLQFLRFLLFILGPGKRPSQGLVSVSSFLVVICVPKAKQKKYVCFRLPTVPNTKLRSPSLILLLSCLVFTIDSFRRKIFQFQVYFCCNLYFKN